MVRTLSCSGRALVVLKNMVFFGCWWEVQHVYLVMEAADVVEDAIAEFAGSHLRYVACRLLTADRRRKWVGAGSRYRVVWYSRVGLLPFMAYAVSRGSVSNC